MSDINNRNSPYILLILSILIDVKKSKMEENRKTSIHLKEETAKRAEKFIQKTGRTLSGLVNVSINHYINHEESLGGFKDAK